MKFVFHLFQNIDQMKNAYLLFLITFLQLETSLLYSNSNSAPLLTNEISCLHSLPDIKSKTKIGIEGASENLKHSASPQVMSIINFCRHKKFL